MILAANGVEVFNNRFINNQSVGTGIISYLLTERPITDKAYYPFSSNISIHDNVYERKPGPPTTRGRFGKLFHSVLNFNQDIPHILYDGIADPATLDKAGKMPPDKRICIRNNTNQSIVNLDAGQGFKHISRDAAPFNCQLEPLKVTTGSGR